MLDVCFELDNHLRGSGALYRENLFNLRNPRDSILEERLSHIDEEPGAQTKEHLGGIFVLKARRMIFASQLIS